MKLKARRAVAAGLTVAALGGGLTGCDGATGTGPNRSGVIELSEPSTRTLPDAVKRAAGSVVLVSNPDWQASGSYIRGGEFVTAGHALRNGANVLIAGCHDTDITTAAGQVAVEKAASVNKTGKDQALLTVDPESAAVKGLRAATLSGSHPHLGERVFFAHHGGRAIYDGFVAGEVTQGPQKGRIAIIDGPGVSKSFGKTTDITTAPGDSGGPVFLDNGQEFAVVSNLEARTVTAAALKTAYGVTITGATHGQQFHVVNVQPVSAGDIRVLRPQELAC